MKEVSYSELEILRSEHPGLLLIDVREPFEHEAYNIGGENIPLGDIMQAGHRIPSTEPVVVYCRKGVRSRIAIQRLSERYGLQNLVNLAGGLENR